MSPIALEAKEELREVQQRRDELRAQLYLQDAAKGKTGVNDKSVSAASYSADSMFFLQRLVRRYRDPRTDVDPTLKRPCPSRAERSVTC